MFISQHATLDGITPITSAGGPLIGADICVPVNTLQVPTGNFNAIRAGILNN